MIVGFTGQRNGMTLQQGEKVAEILVELLELNHAVVKAGLHGDCIGADADFNDICLQLGIETHVRPCTYPNMRAFCEAKQIAEPIAPLKRNKLIVADAAIMIACPPTEEEIVRSGTWATIRYARKAKKPCYIVYPDGKVKKEGLLSWPK